MSSQATHSAWPALAKLRHEAARGELHHERHQIHGPDRIWPETNCYADLSIELLHSLGFDPIPALAGTIAMGFQLDHWQFFKPSARDLRELYGIDVYELPVWRSVASHVAEHLADNRLITLEVDSFHLPDTAGVAYGLEHVKSTIAPFAHDAEARSVYYFHNAAVAHAEGADHDALFDYGLYGSGQGPAPYAEVVDLQRAIVRTPAELRARAIGLARAHLEFAPTTNPVHALFTAVNAQAAGLAAANLSEFHHYAFAMIRLCGSQAELAATFVGWLDPNGPTASAAAFTRVAELAKTIQFKMARIAAGRTVLLDELFDDMSRQWSVATSATIAVLDAGT